MMEEATYEMCWDCKFCGQKKLLGLTHRFCAGCGAPQDPASRYFPPENEKVAVKDNPFVGADVSCPACKQPMSRAAKCCTNCGSPIDKGAEVARRTGVHRVHLSRSFTAVYGQAPSLFRLRCMTARAIRNVVCDGSSLADAAANAGFADQSHFTRAFAREVGTLPSRLRHRFNSLHSFKTLDHAAG